MLKRHCRMDGVKIPLGCLSIRARVGRRGRITSLSIPVRGSVGPGSSVLCIQWRARQFNYGIYCSIQCFRAAMRRSQLPWATFERSSLFSDKFSVTLEHIRIVHREKDAIDSNHLLCPIQVCLAFRSCNAIG